MDAHEILRRYLLWMTGRVLINQLLHLPITALGRPDAFDDAIRFQSGEVLFYRLGARVSYTVVMTFALAVMPSLSARPAALSLPSSDNS